MNDNNPLITVINDNNNNKEIKRKIIMRKITNREIAYIFLPFSFSTPQTPLSINKHKLIVIA